MYNYSDAVANRVKPYFHARTIFNPMWATRLEGLTKVAATAPGHMNHKNRYSGLDVLLPIGAGYMGYRFLLGKAAGEPVMAKKLFGLLGRSPALTVMLLGAGSNVLANVLNVMGGNPESGIPAGLRKMSSTKDIASFKSVAVNWWRPVLLGMGGSYLWSSEAKRKAKYHGNVPGAISNFVIEHPALTGVLGSLALRKFAKGFGKTASANDLPHQNDNLCLQKEGSVIKIDQNKCRDALERSLQSGACSLLDPDLFQSTAKFFDMFSS